MNSSTRKTVYHLLVRLKNTGSIDVIERNKALTIFSVDLTLRFSIDFLELNKNVSGLELAILGQVILSHLQKQIIELNCCYVPGKWSVSMSQTSPLMKSHSSHSDLAIALLQTFVKFKELEAERCA